MSWFYERFVAPSDVNGPITCTRILGQWSVMCGGNGQANAYLNGLWKEALVRLPKDLNVKHVLMLGFGPGETLCLYAKRFPQASLTVVELDPVMVDLAKRFGHLRGSRVPEIHVGDARDVVPKLQRQYDLIILDMFDGLKVAEPGKDPEFIQEVLRHLRSHGVMLYNAYREPDILDALKPFCALAKCWTYKHSAVALCRPFGSGTIGDPLPSVYHHEMTCSEYVQREYAHQGERYAAIRSGEVWGVRKKIPWVTFDFYTGDVDPAQGKRPGGAHLTFWQPIARAPKQPVGWHRCPFPGNRSLTGFSLIPSEGSYHLGWSDHAKRHREKWLRQTEYVLVDADVEAYIRAFAKCGKRRSLISVFSDEVRRKAIGHGNRLTLRVARHCETKEIIAGFASLWIPEIQQTFHVTSFLTPQGQKTSAAFGLVDDCFRIAQSRGCRVLEFDGFWSKGSPNSWKGFSQFKAQFDVFYVRWPGLWVRWD